MTTMTTNPPAEAPAAAVSPSELAGIPDFLVDDEHQAHEPPEARGLRRDAVRLMVSPGDAAPIDSYFTELGRFLAPGDVLVVNTSSTIPAALDAIAPNGEPVLVHLSGPLPGELWLVEPRSIEAGATAPRRVDEPARFELVAGGAVDLVVPFARSQRLWVARLEVDPDVRRFVARHGRPIRYRHVPDPWPLRHYQTVFGREPGSAEMPSASRPFTSDVVTDLVARGIGFAPLVLHTGVSSLELGEDPYPERYAVSEATAATINHAHERGSRVVAIGTTVVRALATVSDDHGVVHPGTGWTEVVVSPAHPVPAVDGLLTGWHEPESTHLLLLQAIAAPGALARAYRAALELGYLWHEFGDSHLILRR